MRKAEIISAFNFKRSIFAVPISAFSFLLSRFQLLFVCFCPCPPSAPMPFCDYLQFPAKAERRSRRCLIIGEVAQAHDGSLGLPQGRKPRHDLRGDEERVGGRPLRRKGLPSQKGNGNLPQ